MRPTARLRVDAETRTVSWRASTGQLLARGAVFVLLVVAAPIVLLGGANDPPLWVTAPVLLLTAGTAAWLATALRAGWDVDDHGIRLGAGRRRPEQLAWTDVEALRVVGAGERADLVAETRAGTRLRVESGAGATELTAAVEAVQRLDLAPPHVTVEAVP